VFGPGNGTRNTVVVVPISVLIGIEATCALEVSAAIQLHVDRAQQRCQAALAGHESATRPRNRTA
jgi:hypothetical protein